MATSPTDEELQYWCEQIGYNSQDIENATTPPPPTQTTHTQTTPTIPTPPVKTTPVGRTAKNPTKNPKKKITQTRMVPPKNRAPTRVNDRVPRQTPVGRGPCTQCLTEKGDIWSQIGRPQSCNQFNLTTCVHGLQQPKVYQRCNGTKGVICYQETPLTPSPTAPRQARIPPKQAARVVCRGQPLYTASPHQLTVRRRGAAPRSLTNTRHV